MEFLNSRCGCHSFEPKLKDASLLSDLQHWYSWILVQHPRITQVLIPEHY